MVVEQASVRALRRAGGRGCPAGGVGVIVRGPAEEPADAACCFIVLLTHTHYPYAPSAARASPLERSPTHRPGKRALLPPVDVRRLLAHVHTVRAFVQRPATSQEAAGHNWCAAAQRSPRAA